MRYLLLLIFTLLIVSCKSKANLTKVIEREVEVIVKDTVFQTKADSSRIAFKVNCINGKPVINFLGGTSGDYLDIPKIKPIGNYEYELLCEARAQELFHKWKETHTKEKVEIPIEVNMLTFWQTLQIYLGRAFILLLLVTLTPRIKKIL